MNRYDKYKDSGFDWIGEIPEHWESIRLKYIGYLYGGLSGKSSKDFNQSANPYNKPFIPFTNIANNKVIDPKQLQYVVIKEEEKQNKVEKDDLFFMMSSENYDDVGKSTILLDDLGEAYLNSFCKGFRFVENNYFPTFINYLLLSHPYRCVLQIEANGYTRINLKIDKVNDLAIKVPPFDEQVPIANYLDQKTAEIDQLIVQKKQLLKFYEEEKTAIINQAVTKGINPDTPMKESGVDWIGEIPEHWDIKRLRYLGKCQNGIGISSEAFGSGFPFVSYSDVGNNMVLPDEVEGLVESTEKDRKLYSVEIGDVFFTRTSETIEEIAFASTCLKTIENAVFAGFLIRFRPNDTTLDINFSKYYFRAQIHRHFFVKEMNLVTRASLSQELLKRLPVLIPPKEEQKNIAQYLDKECARLNAESLKIVKQIELLKEYKQSLISEVVTGKIKVI